MASVTSTAIRPSYGYPTGDGKPMAETELHGKITIDLLLTLDYHFRNDPDVYVWGDLLLFYEEGNKRRHVSPDVFFVRGVPRGLRDNYLTWIEGKGPDVVLEVTSSSTRHVDTHRKFELYRDTLHVPEYFLFDPLGDYLVPRFQGHRLFNGQYVAIDPINGRLPSVELGLHLEGVDNTLRFWDPTTETLLPTTAEERQRADREKRRADREKRRADREKRRAEEAEEEVARLRRENEMLRQQTPRSNGNP